MNEEDVKKIYDGEYSPYNLPEELVIAIWTMFLASAESGFGGGVESFPKGSKLYNQALGYNNNTFFFSGAKTFQQMRELSGFLFDKNGNKVAWKDFLAKALEINNKYYVTWLKVEMETAFHMAKNARAWMDFPDNAMLKYQTQKDERVRPSHKAWDDLIYPKSDPFWNTHYPPNDWNCRCFVIPSLGGKRSLKRKIPQVDDKLFAVNPGKVPWVFNPKHPYFKVPKEFRAMQKTNFGIKKP